MTTKRRNFRSNQLISGILARAKYRAKFLGVPFALTAEDIIIPDTCPVLGLPIIAHNDGKRGYRPDSPSIDRMVPELGYVVGNIRVISARANILKSDATIPEMTRVLSYMRGEL